MVFSPEDLLVILIVAVILFGPQKLPEVARNFGRAMAEFEKAKREFVTEIETKPKSRPPTDGIGEIAKNLGIDTAGKGEEEILREIAERTKAKPANT